MMVIDLYYSLPRYQSNSRKSKSFSNNFIIYYMLILVEIRYKYIIVLIWWNNYILGYLYILVENPKKKFIQSHLHKVFN